MGQPKIGLGTVQFGMDYGISNSDGKPGSGEVASILSLAKSKGIKILDTASLYGESELVLGQNLSAHPYFDIVTKTPFFKNDFLTAQDGSFLKETLQTSLTRLGVQKVYGLMIHRAEDLLKEGSEYLIEALQELKSAKQVQKIGVSVYEKAQVEAIFARYPLDLIQIPVSVFDQRLVLDGTIKNLKRTGVEIHSRSAFLQGLIFLEPEKLNPFFAPALEQVKFLSEDANRLGLKKFEIALQYLNSIPEIDHIICGVNSKTELQEILNASTRLSTSKMDFSAYRIDDLNILNPAKWPKTSRSG